MPHLDSGQVFVLFIIAISIGGGIIKRYVSMIGERMDLRMSRQDQNMAEQVAAMRQELAQLRDTSTQFDMSLQRRLEEMEHRLGFVEGAGKSAAGPMPTAPSPPSMEAPQQTIGVPHS